MSLYNLVNRVQQTTFFVLPMLGKHPEEYPRFRDCFLGKMFQNEEMDAFGIPRWHHGSEELISIYCRVGGGNRDRYKKEIEEMREMKDYVEDFDDEFDSTFAVFVFNVPDKWKKDFISAKDEKKQWIDLSKEYQKQIEKVFPNLIGKLPWNN